MAGRKAADTAENKVQEGELAVKLTSDIDGGIGSHKSGTTLRNLSPSAFNTLTQGGLGEAVESGSSADGAVDASAPSVSQGGSGTGAGGGATE